MIYARLNDAGTAFEPERNLIHAAYGLDGGGSLAADAQGNVYVFWHAPLPGQKGEQNRRVWLAKSSDEGKTFEPEHIAFDKPIGACGCCGMKAYADAAGNLYVLFRSADQMVNRDIWLLTSTDHGKTFTGRRRLALEDRRLRDEFAVLRSRAERTPRRLGNREADVLRHVGERQSHRRPSPRPAFRTTASTPCSRPTPKARHSSPGPKAWPGKRAAPPPGRSTTKTATRRSRQADPAYLSGA